MPPPLDMQPPLHVFEDLDEQTSFPKADSDVSDGIAAKLKFTRSSKQPEVPPEPPLGLGFLKAEHKELQDKCEKATGPDDFPFAEVFDAYYDKAMKTHTVRETNRYYRQCKAKIEEQG